ncbi:hypothetical protein LINPERHAP1_LOCUS23172, partial [Linum perenne]
MKTQKTINLIFSAFIGIYIFLCPSHPQALILHLPVLENPGTKDDHLLIEQSNIPEVDEEGGVDYVELE